jgi:hypothetical protein
LAENLNTIINLIHPEASGVGVFVSDQVWVLFDREIDESTLKQGNFFVTGPDFDTWIGPDLAMIHGLASDGSGSDDVLESPGYEGIVQGAITFERIDPTSNTIIDGLDTVGSGLIYRTKAIFTPVNRLQADTDYRVYLSGDEDESDNLQTGISARTVFDPVVDPGNTGTGKVSFDGGYTGTINDTYHIEITQPGESGTAKFIFWRAFDPSSVFGPFFTRESGVLLSDGVTAFFDEGSYQVGDQWTVVVKPRNIFLGHITWPFKTGSGNVLSIPDSTSTSVIGDIYPATVTPGVTGATSTFSVISTDPINGATNQELFAGEKELTVNFNSDIDQLSVVSGVDVLVHSYPVDGASEFQTLIAEPSVAGSEMTIVIASGQMTQNRLIVVTLDASIRSTGGVSLGSDYSFQFTTEYEPLYCTVRRLRIMQGKYLEGISDDTLNFAIHLASIEADALTWNKNYLDDNYFNFVRSQWACCRAAQILLINTMGGSGQLRSKRLGDLEVTYNTQNADVSMAKWESALMAGGRQVQTAQGVVKGEYDPDRPPVGRGWYHNRNLRNNQTPAGNQRVKFQGYRRYRTVYDRNIGPGGRGWWNR